MKWSDDKVAAPPSIVWRALTAKKQSDKYGWMTIKELQAVTEVPRDALRQIMYRFIADGSVERTGIRGRLVFYRQK